MTSLSSCYFCGAAVGASLEEHSVPAEAPADDQVTLTLCSRCVGKLDQLLDQLPVSSAGGAGDEVAAPPRTDAETELLGDDPDPIFAGEDGTLLGAEDAVDDGTAGATADPEGTPPTSSATARAVNDADDAETDDADAGDADADDAEAGADSPNDASSPAPTADVDEQDNDLSDDSATDTPARGASSAESGVDSGAASQVDAPGDTSPSEPATATSPRESSPAGSGEESGPSRSTPPESGDSSARSSAADAPATDAPAADASEETRSDSGVDETPGERDGSATGVSTRTYNRVVRLLQNREFPVDRAEFEALATSAYELELDQVEGALDVAVEKGLLDERDGHLHRPE